MIPRKLFILRTARTDRIATKAERRYTAGTRSLPALVFLIVFAIAGVVSAQEQPRVFRVPFHSVQGMIFLDATVAGKSASLLLDTGANNTILSPQAVGAATVQLRALQATNAGTGGEGDYVMREVDLRLAERHWMNGA